MLTIVKLKYSDDKISVELDSGESLVLPYHVAGLFKLSAGQTIDATEYAQLKEESQRFQCQKKALDYLSIRIRSAMEMERYLLKKGFSHDIIREILRGLVDAHYIDDYDYAVRFINSRMNKKLTGKHLVASELQKKGISRNIIKQTLRESGIDRTNMDEIYEDALKKYNTLKHKKNSIPKLAYFLQRRGFDIDIVNAIIRRIAREDRQ